MVPWVLLAVAAGAVHSPDAGERVSIVNGYPFVEAWVNGRGPFRMLLDTGATSCALSENAARAAGLAFDSKVRLTTAVGERFVPAARTARVRVGAATAEGIEVLAQDLDVLRRADPSADGLIGQSFLSRSPYMIDYRRGRIWFGEAAMREAAALSPPLQAEESYGRMVVPVIIGSGAPRRMVLDSGAAALVLHCGGRCPPLDHVQSGSAILTNAGQSAAKRGTLRQVRVGELSLQQVPAMLVESYPLGGEEDGLLPALCFSAIYVDSAGHTVRLAR